MRRNRVLSCLLVGFVLMCAVGAQLTTTFYDTSCPALQSIVRRLVLQAIVTETRMAASLLRMHFHDCFVNGCDASLLLDDTATVTGEKTAAPNNNSVRGFDVIDTIKTAVENNCSKTVSCADIVAIAARDSVLFSGGPSWSVLLGRRDATTVNGTAPNFVIPSPVDNLTEIIRKFADVGLSITDVVSLSGGHTIGRARCATFNNRLFDFNSSGSPDPTLESTMLATLQVTCPPSGDNSTLVSLDRRSRDWFDNAYFKNLQSNNGLLLSDQELYSSSNAQTKALVDTYSASPSTFSTDFVNSMIKMGNISPLTGTAGEIRTNCRVVNS
ncbi:hypothetical protein SUGI_0126960 [Cryptomeria japonica]|uniref:peroxidase A2 n=1 Tax=Cryptomeria japonica TaxID=3369 RepID=UPI002408AC6D|nr:peroxidase A2 [Cryptomeria japonica]GLJ10367.1 hypothetical protein SUGI_0126960 [Cryptomeria japonica]